MRSFLAMMFYIDYKCSTQPAFRKTLLLFMLLFVFLLWSPWRPLLCPVFRVCPAPVLRADTPRTRPKLRSVERVKCRTAGPATIQTPVQAFH